VEWGRDDTSFKNRQQVTTDANGDYSIALNALDGRCSLAASAPDYSATPANEGITGGRQTINFVLSPIPDVNFVAGKVTDEQGVPIADVRVEAFTPVTGAYSSFSMPPAANYFPGPDRVACTDAQGHFRIVDVPPEQVQLNLRSPHRHVNDNNYPVGNGVQITMTGSGKAGVLQGRIIDANTRLPPKSLADVHIIQRYSTKSHLCSDEDGHFCLPGEPSLGGEYVVYFYAKGYAATKSTIVAVEAGSKHFAEILLTSSPPCTLSWSTQTVASQSPARQSSTESETCGAISSGEIWRSTPMAITR